MINNESLFGDSLGNPASIEKYGRVVCLATGVGVAQILPICKALQEKGNKVVGIIGAKNEVFLQVGDCALFLLVVE